MFDGEKLLHDINNLICGRHDDFAYMRCIHLYNVALQLSLVIIINHHQSLFIHEVVSFYMVFQGIVFKTRLKY